MDVRKCNRLGRRGFLALWMDKSAPNRVRSEKYSARLGEIFRVRIKDILPICELQGYSRYDRVI